LFRGFGWLLLSLRDIVLLWFRCCRLWLFFFLVNGIECGDVIEGFLVVISLVLDRVRVLTLGRFLS